MGEVEYWIELEKLTTERIDELTYRLSSGLVKKEMKGWTESTLKTNKTWHEFAKIRQENIQHAAKVAYYEAVVERSTFRGNDDQ